MTRNCTQNDLVRFIYSEVSIEEHLMLLEELHADWDMREEHKLLSETIEQLPKVTFAPSSASVNRILLHSKKAVAVA